MDLREVTEAFKELIGYIILFLVIAFIFAFVVAFHPISGNSMSPTLEEGEVVLVSKLSYKLKNVERNDIIVLKKDKKYYIKRVIGLPGEKIDYLDGILYIDDKGYIEDFLDENIHTSNFMFKDICPLCLDYKIPNDMYLVLGDNREESMDSRSNTFGLVSKSEISGKVFFKVWPINLFGKVK